MKEVTVAAWCDGCAAEDGDSRERSDGEVTVALGIGNRPDPARVLDLCKRHREVLIEPLARLLGEYGAAPVADVDVGERRKGQQPANGRDIYCLWCPADYASMSGYRGHLRAAHGIRDTSLGTVYGDLCPLDGRKAKSLAMHAHLAHACNITEVFRLAESEGDPHLIVARRRAVTAGKRGE